jgi:hypothetical protein
MGRAERRKCKCCRKSFRLDPRSHVHQYITARRRVAERRGDRAIRGVGEGSLRSVQGTRCGKCCSHLASRSSSMTWLWCSGVGAPNRNRARCARVVIDGSFTT